MALQISTVSTEPATINLVLEGELDAVTSPELERRMADVLTDEVKIVVFDLSKLSYISSAGLRTFAKIRKAMVSREGKICFVNLSPQVQKVFDIVKAVPLSELFRSTEELDAYLATMQQRAGMAAKADRAAKAAAAASSAAAEAARFAAAAAKEAEDKRAER